MKTTLLVALAAATLFILASAQTSTPVIPAPPQFVTFGLVGLAPDQTARVNALGLPMGGPILAGASCQVTVSFLDDQGNSLKTVTQTVTGGKSTPFDLQFSEISSATTNRLQIRGTVRTNFTINNPNNPGGPVPIAVGSCAVLPTFEVFNQANGRTTVLLDSTQNLPTVQPL
jgi:hypothetical protein